jgi:acetyltransferase-like isoleucine patch superfamily enzyme
VGHEPQRQDRQVDALRVWLFDPSGPAQQFASQLRKRWASFRNPHAQIQFHEPVYAGPGFAIDAPAGGTFVAGPGSEFRRGFRAELSGPQATVSVGSETIFTHEALIQCASAVSLGAQCQIDQGTLLVDGDFRVRRPGESAAALPHDPHPLTIGDHVMITTKCTVIADIGSYSMVGANSVVTKPLPAHSLAAGSPAEVIGHFGPEAR